MSKIIYATIVLFLLITVGFLTLGLMMSNGHKPEFAQQVVIKKEKEIRIIFTSDIENNCKNFVVDGIIGGCYIHASNLIYINDQISAKNLNYVLTHEIGHWMTEKTYTSLFNNDWEKAADSFSDWINNKKVDPFVKEYFDDLWFNL